MRYRTFQTLANAVAEASAQESELGNERESQYLSKLIVDIARASLHFERLRWRFYRYLRRREGHHGHSSRAT